MKMTYITKATLNHLLIEIIDNLSAEELERLALAESQKQMGALLVDFITSSFIHTQFVHCELKNNLERILRADAVQCPNCSRYFCLDHNLDYCPECAAKL
jgi:hypothetical protein